MKFAGLITLLLTASSALAADQAATAYNALRVVGTQKGQKVLDRVVELRGRNGTPQPAVWKIVLAEPGARGGVREIEVQRGKIISERTPVAQGQSGEVMNFSRLNLDSEGVFTVVNQQTEKQGLSFTRIDYALRSGSGGGSPVWTADLFDGARGKIATLQLAADSGAVIAQTKEHRGSGDRDEVRGNSSQEPRLSEDDVFRRQPVAEGHSRPGEPFRGVPDFFHRLGQRMERRGEQLESFFTGKKGQDAGRR